MIAGQMAGRNKHVNAEELDDAEKMGEGAEELDDAEEMGEGAAPADGEITPAKFMYIVEGTLAKDKKALQATIQMLRDASDLPRALAQAAYALVAMVDEKTQGLIADEDLAEVGADTLGVVAEIAEQEGLQIGSREVAAATNLMIRQYLEENGEVEALQAMQEQDIDAAAGEIENGWAQEQAPPAGGQAPPPPEGGM
jgi:hypothetical protein